MKTAQQPMDHNARGVLVDVTITLLDLLDVPEQVGRGEAARLLGDKGFHIPDSVVHGACSLRRFRLEWPA